MHRRTFLARSALATLAAAAPACLGAIERPMRLRILVLGGTHFIGIHIVRHALARGHTVSIFTRGQHQADLGDRVQRLIGDRNGKLDALNDGQWDAVIDDSGFQPRQVQSSAELLAARIGQYLFVSTISVYDDLSQPRDETAALAKLAEPNDPQPGNNNYGALKALCEQAVQRVLPAHSTIVRPGLIVGPYDSTDRFTYWPARFARGGNVLAPGTAHDPIQFIDARDLAAYMIHLVEKRYYGVFNALSPSGHFTMGELIDASRRSAQQLAKPRATTVTWVPANFLEKQNVQPWSDMPAWVPETGDDAGAMQISAARALATGLTIRPIQQTVRDTLRWQLSRPAEQQLKLQAGLTADREAQVLSAWHEQHR